jgi:hypothetical protein
VFPNSHSPPKSWSLPIIAELVSQHPCAFQSIHSTSSKNTLMIANNLNSYRADNHASPDILLVLFVVTALASPLFPLRRNDRLTKEEKLWASGLANMKPDLKWVTCFEVSKISIVILICNAGGIQGCFSNSIHPGVVLDDPDQNSQSDDF